MAGLKNVPIRGDTITGCPSDYYPLSISIPDFSDYPIKKDQVCNFNPNGLT